MAEKEIGKRAFSGNVLKVVLGVDLQAESDCISVCVCVYVCMGISSWRNKCSKSNGSKLELSEGRFVIERRVGARNSPGMRV